MDIKMPKLFFIFPFVIILTMEFFSKEILEAGITELVYRIIIRVIESSAFLLLGISIGQSKGKR